LLLNFPRFSFLPPPGVSNASLPCPFPLAFPFPPASNHTHARNSKQLTNMADAKTTPGRADVLTTLFGTCVDDIANSCSFQDYAALFAELVDQKNASLRDELFHCYAQTVQELRANAKQEFDVLCNAYGVREKLANVDALCREHGITDADINAASKPEGTLADGEMPLAAARAQRIAAKEAEKKVLLEMLEQSQAMRAEKQALVDERRALVNESVKHCAPADAVLEGVHEASTRWINA